MAGHSVLENLTTKQTPYGRKFHRGISLHPVCVRSPTLLVGIPLLFYKGAKPWNGPPVPESDLNALAPQALPYSKWS